MRLGLENIIEKVHISRYFESPEADLHIADNAAVLITLTPGRQNELSDCQKAKVRIAVLRIMDVKTRWNSSLELHERPSWLREFTSEWLQNLNFAEYWP
jgi:hypothetical protein